MILGSAVKSDGASARPGVSREVPRRRKQGTVKDPFHRRFAALPREYKGPLSSVPRGSPSHGTEGVFRVLPLPTSKQRCRFPTNSWGEPMPSPVF